MESHELFSLYELLYRYKGKALLVEQLSDKTWYYNEASDFSLKQARSSRSFRANITR